MTASKSLGTDARDSYSILETSDGCVVNIGLLGPERHSLALSRSELGRVALGSVVRKGGVLVRREGSDVEFRVVRPGVLPDRRRIGMVPLEKFD